MTHEMARDDARIDSPAGRNGTQWHGMAEEMCGDVAAWRREMARDGTREAMAHLLGRRGVGGVEFAAEIPVTEAAAGDFVEGQQGTEEGTQQRLRLAFDDEIDHPIDAFFDWPDAKRRHRRRRPRLAAGVEDALA